MQVLSTATIYFCLYLLSLKKSETRKGMCFYFTSEVFLVLKILQIYNFRILLSFMAL